MTDLLRERLVARASENLYSGCLHLRGYDNEDRSGWWCPDCKPEPASTNSPFANRDNSAMTEISNAPDPTLETVVVLTGRDVYEAVHFGYPYSFDRLTHGERSQWEDHAQRIIARCVVVPTGRDHA